MPFRLHDRKQTAETKVKAVLLVKKKAADVYR